MKEFIPGYIYGEKAIPPKKGEPKRREAKAKVLKSGRKYDQEVDRNDWFIQKTPVEKYATVLGINLPDYMREMARSLKGRKLNVLDVGVGAGDQWVETGILDEPEFDFHASSLSKFVQAKLKDKTVACNAGGLHKRFPAESFDLIVTHSGLQDEILPGIENIVHLLRPGGEAIIVQHGYLLRSGLQPDSEEANAALTRKKRVLLEKIAAPRFFKILKTSRAHEEVTGHSNSFIEKTGVHIRKNLPSLKPPSLFSSVLNFFGNMLKKSGAKPS